MQTKAPMPLLGAVTNLSFLIDTQNKGRESPLSARRALSDIRQLAYSIDTASILEKYLAVLVDETST
jgi:hypothetical protein